jgi:hypothetical protein
MSNDFGLSLDREPQTHERRLQTPLVCQAAAEDVDYRMPLGNIARTYNVSDSTILCLTV